MGPVAHGDHETGSVGDAVERPGYGAGEVETGSSGGGDGTRMHPAGRMTRPEDVAGALVALSSPAAGWVSGNVIGVDGAEDIAGGR